MGKSDMNASKTVKVEYYSTSVVTDRNAYRDSNNRLIPATWHIAQNTGYQPAPITVLTEVRGGGTTPGFTSRNRPAILPTNGFNYRKWQLQDSLAINHQSRPSSGGGPPVDSYWTQSPTNQIETDWVGIVLDSDIEAAKRRLATGLRNKIKGQSFNAAQAVAERRQTAQTVLSAATTIANAVRAIKRGDPIGAAKALGVKPPKRANRRIRSNAASAADAAAQHWLALQYGWKPLLQDVHGAAEALANSQNNTQFFKSSVKTVINRSDQKTTNLLASGVKGFDKKILKGKEEVTIKMGVTYRQTSKTVSTAKQLGLTNPAQLAWELLPFSFVADWFLPVGNFLSSLDATLGLEFMTGYLTIFRRRDGSCTWDTNTLDGSDIRYVRFIHNSWEGIDCSRVALGGFPSVSAPSFKNPVSVTHAVNAIALLHQLFRK